MVMVFAVWSTIHLNTRSLQSPLWYRPLLNAVSHHFWTPWRKVFHKDEVEGEDEFPSFIVRKVLEAVITLLFPECAVAVAVEEAIVAWYIWRTTRKVKGWERFSLKQAHLVAMGGIKISGFNTPQDFDQLVLHNRLNFHTFPSYKKISLRAKKDYFDKAIAVFQGFYFIANCIARYLRAYDIELLEFLALNYIIYAVMLYALRVGKPQELIEPFEIIWDAELINNYPGSNRQAGTAVDPDSPFHEWYTRKRWQILSLVVLTLAVTGVLNFSYRLGANHNHADLLWQTTLAGIACISLFPLRRIVREQNVFKKDKSGWLYWIAGLVFWISCFAYAAWRIYLWISAFLEFKYAPARSYVTAPSWTQYLFQVGG